MYLWMPMVAWSAVRLIGALIHWRSRICYERARAASVVDVLRAAPPGVTVRDSRADGTVLCVDTLGRQDLPSHGAYETAGRKPC